MSTPAKYRKKPVVIEAMRNDGEIGTVSAILDCVNGGKGAEGPATYDLTGKPSMSIHIETLEGVMRADVGWWIIKGVAGEFYPCKPDIFAETYEAVE